MVSIKGCWPTYLSAPPVWGSGSSGELGVSLDAKQLRARGRGAGPVTLQKKLVVSE